MNQDTTWIEDTKVLIKKAIEQSIADNRAWGEAVRTGSLPPTVGKPLEYEPKSSDIAPTGEFVKFTNVRLDYFLEATRIQSPDFVFGEDPSPVVSAMSKVAKWCDRSWHEDSLEKIAGNLVIGPSKSEFRYLTVLEGSPTPLGATHLDCDTIKVARDCCHSGTPYLFIGKESQAAYLKPVAALFTTEVVTEERRYTSTGGVLNRVLPNLPNGSYNPAYDEAEFGAALALTDSTFEKQVPASGEVEVVFSPEENRFVATLRRAARPTCCDQAAIILYRRTR